MINYKLVYELNTQMVNSIVQHLFVSHGRAEIYKAIQYHPAGEYNNRTVFNLGFGNYDPKTGKIEDDDNSNNGDQYHMFQTVLSTIPHFFQLFPHAYLTVLGSDSRPGFKDWCKKQCIKQCLPGICKRFGRRIRVYQRYVEKYWNILNKNYGFEGGRLNSAPTISTENYSIGEVYDAILIFKRNT